MDFQIKPNLRTLLILVVMFVGAVIGGAAMQYWRGTSNLAAAQTAPAGDLAAQVARLNMLVPSQSHTMTDVGYQWASLWYAAQSKNWPLAQFFFDEARQHIAWTVAIRPIRKLPDGTDVNIKALFSVVDSSALATVQLAIQGKNSAQFDAAYKQGLEACYMCHKASGKPYLRPEVPTAPPQTIINFDPNAKWPE